MKTRQDPSTKQYYKCLSCPRFRHTCAGLPTRDMTLREWCELIRDVSDVFNLSNAYIAKEAEVSIKTVDRIEAVNVEQDIMRSTATRIERVVLGPVGDHTCYLDQNGNDTTEQINRLMAEIERLEKEKDRYVKIIDKYLD